MWVCANLLWACVPWAFGVCGGQKGVVTPFEILAVLKVLGLGTCVGGALVEIRVVCDPYIA